MRPPGTVLCPNIPRSLIEPSSTEETSDAAPAQAIRKAMPRKKLSSTVRPMESIMLALYFILGIRILLQHFFIRVLTPASAARRRCVGWRGEAPERTGSICYISNTSETHSLFICCEITKEFACSLLFDKSPLLDQLALFPVGSQLPVFWLWLAIVTSISCFFA